MKNAERIPVAAPLAEVIGGIEVTAGQVGEHSDAAIGSDAGAPWSQPESESLRHCQERATRITEVRMLPAGAIGVVATAFENHPESFGKAESLRVDLRCIEVVARRVIQHADAEEGRSLRAGACHVDIIAGIVGQDADSKQSRPLRVVLGAIGIVA